MCRRKYLFLSCFIILHIFLITACSQADKKLIVDVFQHSGASVKAMGETAVAHIDTAYYNDIKWGASAKDIIQKEGMEPDYINSGMISVMGYENRIFEGYGGTVEYIMEKDKLEEVYFDIELRNTDTEERFQVFSDLLRKMEEKYGSASINKTLIRTEPDTTEEIEGIVYHSENPYLYTSQWSGFSEERSQRYISLTLYDEAGYIEVSFAKK